MPIPVRLDQPYDVAVGGAVISLRDCVALGPAFTELVDREASEIGVESRALAVRTLLHLPRMAERDRPMRVAAVVDEIGATGRQLAEDAKFAGHLVAASPLEVKSLAFVRFADDRAAEIFARLHYLRSARSDSLNFALLDPDGLPVSLCSLTPLAWRRVGRAIEALSGVAMDDVWDVCRVYSANHAPRNAISYLLSQVRSWLRRQEPHVRLLSTAVDLNLGFTGASYRADNWKHWMSVQARPYLYHNGRYVSPRQLRAAYGTSNITELAECHPGQRFQQSQVQLLDTMIFCTRVSGETEPVAAEARRRLHR